MSVESKSSSSESSPQSSVSTTSSYYRLSTSPITPAASPIISNLQNRSLSNSPILTVDSQPPSPSPSPCSNSKVNGIQPNGKHLTESSDRFVMNRPDDHPGHHVVIVPETDHDSEKKFVEFYAGLSRLQKFQQYVRQFQNSRGEVAGGSSAESATVTSPSASSPESLSGSSSSTDGQHDQTSVSPGDDGHEGKDNKQLPNGHEKKEQNKLILSDFSNYLSHYYNHSPSHHHHHLRRPVSQESLQSGGCGRGANPGLGDGHDHQIDLIHHHHHHLGTNHNGISSSGSFSSGAASEVPSSSSSSSFFIGSLPSSSSSAGGGLSIPALTGSRSTSIY